MPCGCRRIARGRDERRDVLQDDRAGGESSRARRRGRTGARPEYAPSTTQSPIVTCPASCALFENVVLVADDAIVRDVRVGEEQVARCRSRVSPRSCAVPALIVTNSRKTLSSPIVVVVGSPPYLRSCGISPIDANWKTRLRAPRLVRPVITTCGPMTVPAPTRTPRPTIEYAPTSTSAASSAFGSTSAVGWIRATSGQRAARALASGMRIARQQVGLGDDLAVDLARARRICRCRAPAAAPPTRAPAGRPAAPAGGSAHCRSPAKKMIVPSPGVRPTIFHARIDASCASASITSTAGITG